MQIVLYNMKCKKKKADKKSRDITVLAQFGDNNEEYFIKQETSLLDIELLIRWENNTEDITILRKCNYVYIRLLQRYYFVVDKKMDTAGRLTLVLHEDVLQSFNDGILGSVQMIVRSTNIYDGRYVDSEYPLYNTTYTIARNLPGTPFSRNNMASGTACIALTVSGGGV